MINLEKGRYWDEGIELVSGCTKCSPGCDYCWALSGEARFKKCSHCGATKKKCDEYKTIAPEFRASTACCSECDHSGKVTVHPERLSRFNTRKPKVFAIWNDLHHKFVTDEFKEKVYTAIGILQSV
jgi:protein gp37